MRTSSTSHVCQTSVALDAQFERSPSYSHPNPSVEYRSSTNGCYFAVQSLHQHRSASDHLCCETPCSIHIRGPTAFLIWTKAVKLGVTTMSLLGLFLRTAHSRSLSLSLPLSSTSRRTREDDVSELQTHLRLYVYIFQAHLLDGPTLPPCPQCAAAALRATHAGKRSHGVGRLRPRIVSTLCRRRCSTHNSCWKVKSR